MELSEVINLLSIERECVSRDCDRNCAVCDLVQTREELIDAYDTAIEVLKEASKIMPTAKHKQEIVRCKDCKWSSNIGYGWFYCRLDCTRRIDNSYCAYGERSKNHES